MFQTANGIIAVGQSKTTGEMTFGGAIGTGTAKQANDVLEGRQKLQNYYEDIFSGLPDEYRQASINSTVGAMSLLGFGTGDTASRSDDQLLTASNQAARLLNQFDYDYVQGLVDGNKWWRKVDLWPLGDRQFIGNYKPPITQGTMAVGIMLNASGISDPREFTRAFVEYQEGLRDHVPYMPERDFARYVGTIEADVNESIQTGEPVPITDPKNGNRVVKTIDVEGKDKEEIRTEVLAELAILYQTGT
jgi:hypothetical protein